MTLERLVAGVIRRMLPDRLAADAAADLLDDHRRVRHSRGRVIAALWLIVEAATLSATFLMASAKQVLRSSILIRRDAWHAVRALSRRPGSTVGSMVMLAAGLAAVAGAAGLAATLLFKPISRTNPDGVRRLAAVDRNGRTLLGFSELELDAVRRAVGGSTTVASVNLQPVVLRAGDADTQTLAEVVSGKYFELVGVEMRAGRPLLTADAVAGSPPVIVISDAIWRDRFGRDPAAVGANLFLNGTAFSVIGVVGTAGGSSFLGASVDAWISTAHADVMLNRGWRTNATDRFWAVFAGVDATARAPLEAALSRAGTELAGRLPEPWRERRLTTVPGTVIAGSQRRAAASLASVLGAFAVLILAAAAANVGGLMLAASAAERSRAAILLAMGAGRAAIVRRQLIEGGLMGVGAGVGALALYQWIRREVASVTLLPTLSLRLDLPFDAAFAATVVGAGLAVGVLLALAPALWTTRLDVAQALRDGSSRTGGGADLSRARRVLVAAQVAVSVTLLAGAVLLSRSVATLSALDVGFPRHGLVALDFDLEPSAPAMATLPAMAKDALARVAAVPGVVAAAMANRAPIDSSTPTIAVVAPGSGGRSLEDVSFYLATAGYFETVGIPLVHGRTFTAAEADAGADVVIVNQTTASRLWPDGDILDRALTLQPENRTVRVIGVSGNSKYRSLSELPRAHIYLPTAPAFTRALLVRTNGDPREALRAVQRVLDQVGPGVVGFFPRTLEDHLAIDMLPTRAAALSAAMLGGVALLLSAAGLYGIVMWFVELRRREIGVRLALGASANRVRRLVVGQALSAAAPGLAIGTVMAMALMLFGRSLFVGVGRIDDVSSVGLGVLALLAVVLLASYPPSRRATRVDPVIALRDH